MSADNVVLTAVSVNVLINSCCYGVFSGLSHFAFSIAIVLGCFFNLSFSEALANKCCYILCSDLYSASYTVSQKTISTVYFGCLLCSYSAVQ